MTIIKRLIRAELSNDDIQFLMPFVEQSDSAEEMYMLAYNNKPTETKKILNKNNYKQIYNDLVSNVHKSEWKEPNGTIDKYFELSDIVCKPNNIKIIDKTHDEQYSHTADATNDYINVNLQKDKFFSKQTFDHEIAHVLSSSNTELGNAIMSNYGDAFGRYNVEKQHFVGISYNPEESWADAYSMYYNYPSALQSKYPKAYKVVDYLVHHIVNNDEIRNAYYQQFSDIYHKNIEEY